MVIRIGPNDWAVQEEGQAIRWDFRVHPFGIPIAQTWPQFFGMLALINRYGPHMLIELGVDQGGLGSLMVMRNKYVPSFHFLGIERNIGRINPIYKQLSKDEPRHELLYADIYSEETKEYVQKRIAEISGNTAIFCDGGDKLLELKTYSKFLKKKGDIIVGHDYPGDYDDKDLEFLLDDFEPLDENFFKKFLRIPAFMRR
ncbi:hypothetical protein LCGC14_1446610 [marine sediment metagenome]|uniref:Rhamnosyl O-methyltransferase n=1 Tax=marine sediment metagenome TaxID=412755 RepID=A0A0F9JJT6_9ZZZZ